MPSDMRVNQMQRRKAASERVQSSERVPVQRANAMQQGRNHAAYRADHQAAVQEMPVRKERYFYDYSLLFGVIFLFALGLLIIYSSSQYMAALEKQGDSSYYFTRQLFIGSAGLAGAIIMSVLDYRWLVSFLHGILIKIAYWGSNVLLAMTLVMGLASHGKMRWISIAGISFQPAEVAKIGLIVYLANFIAVHGPAVKRRHNLLLAIGFSAIPTVLILRQNISSAVIVALIAAVMLFVAIDDVKIFALLGTLAAAGIFSLKPLIRLFIERTGYVTRPEKYYLRRILGWAAPEVFPDDAYQTLQSIYAIGSGGMTGHGLGESIQKFGKIPEVQNDMIFAIVCEEFGFIGAATLIVLFIYIIYRIYKIAVNANDLFGTMICTGVMAHLGTQVVLNIAVVSGTIPNTGVTLPFISYGGSAILFTMAEIGLVLSVAHKIKIYY